MARTTAIAVRGSLHSETTGVEIELPFQSPQDRLPDSAPQARQRSPIRVLIATPFGRGGQGGIDRLMYMVMDELAKLGDMGLAVESAPTRGGRGLVAAQLVFAKFLIRMVWLCLTRRLDLVHLNLASRGSTLRKFILFVIARITGVRTVIHLHGPDFRQFWASARPPVQAAIAWMFRDADRIIVLGTVWRELIATRVPEAEERIVTMANAVPRPALARVKSDGTVRILFLGRLGERKGTPQLVQALHMLRPLPGWSAILAGDGEVEATAREITRLDLAERVQIPGWVGPENAAKLLAGADILVLPSFDENLPMSVIEAMAHGLAVVATPVGAVEDIVIHNETGLLVQPGDAEALAASLKLQIDDPDLRLRLGTRAQSLHRERLDIVPYVKDLARLWKETATRPRQR